MIAVLGEGRREVEEVLWPIFDQRMQSLSDWFIVEPGKSWAFLATEQQFSI